MPIEINAPGGELVRFPDGTSDDTIRSVMRKTYGGPQAELRSTPAQSPSLGERITDLIKGDEGDRVAPEWRRLAEGVPKALSMIPGIGALLAGDQAAHESQRGNFLGAATNALGVIAPGAGGLAAPAAPALEEAAPAMAPAPAAPALPAAPPAPSGGQPFANLIRQPAPAPVPAPQGLDFQQYVAMYGRHENEKTMRLLRAMMERGQ